MDKLKPCPHCEGKAKIKDWISGYESGTTIICTECGASINEGVESGNGWHERAVSKWNRRAQPANEPLTLEQLKEMDKNPVWIEDIPRKYARWQIFDSKIPWDNYSNYGKTWVAYRRKPEESK